VPAPIEEYALAYVVGAAESLPITDAYVRSKEMLEALGEISKNHLLRHDADKFVDVPSVANSFAAALEAGKVFDYTSDGWAGEYVRFRANRYPKFREQFLAADAVHGTSMRVGKRFYPDVFRSYLEREIMGDNIISIADDLKVDVAPAADRMVPFNHNAPDYQEIAKGIAELHEELRGANDLEIHEDEKDRILRSLSSASLLWDAAQLKAMQIKVGVVMAVEDAIAAFGSTVRVVAAALLVDMIKAFVRNHAGIDLDKI